MTDEHTIDEPLARNRDFRVLLGTQSISSLGDAITFTAMPLLVFALTGSGLAMGVVGALQTLPDLVFGMVAGALADRSDRKRMMFLADMGRAFLTAMIPLSVFLHGPTMGVILLVAAPMSVLRSFFLAGYTASVPALVGRSQIARANSIFEAVYSMGYIVGPAAAGLLATAIGPGNTLVIDAASFGLSSMGLFLVRRDLRAPIDRPRAHLLVEIREGIEFIVHRPVLRAAILFWGCTSVISAPLVAALTVHVIRDLRLSSSVLGLLLAAFGVGTVAGALVLSRASNQRAVAPFLFGGNLAAASGLVALAGIDVVPVMIGLAALIGVAQSASFLTYLTMRTTYTPDELLGRVGSTARTISLGLQPVGLLIGGAAIDLISGSTTIVVMGVAIAAVTLAFFALSPLRHATLQPTAR